MAHPVYPDKEWPAFGTDSAFCKKGLVSYETWTQFPYEVQNVQQSKNAEFIAAANPATVIELLDRLEAAGKERDDLLEALETLSKMAEAFPSELHEKHPDVVAARAAITIATGEQP